MIDEGPDRVAHCPERCLCVCPSPRSDPGQGPAALGTIALTNTSQHLFPILPPELRIKVWAFSLPQPRVVPVRCGAKSLSPSSHDFQRSSSSSRGCTSSAQIPANLHVCRESRLEALQSYHPSFGIARGPGQVFFDPERDILYFGARDGYMASEAQFLTVMSLCNQEELSRVRYVAINDALFWINSNYHSMAAANLTVEVIMQIRNRIPNLRELIFVPRDENPVYSDDAIFLAPAMGQTRMSRQIQAAMKTVQATHPDWTPLSWRIMALSAVPDQDVLDQSVMGYPAGQRVRDTDEAVLRRFTDGSGDVEDS